MGLWMSIGRCGVPGTTEIAIRSVSCTVMVNSAVQALDLGPMGETSHPGQQKKSGVDWNVCRVHDHQNGPFLIMHAGLTRGADAHQGNDQSSGCRLLGLDFFPPIRAQFRNQILLEGTQIALALPRFTTQPGWNFENPWLFHSRRIPQRR